MRTSALWVIGVAVAMSAGTAGATLVSSYGMNELSGNLADSAGGVTMTPVNAAAFSYGTASVPSGAYGAITLTPAQATAFGTGVFSNGTSIFNNTTPNNPLNLTAAPLTVMAWVRPNSTTPAVQRIVSGSGGDGNGWGNGILAGGNQRYTTYGKTDFNQNTGATVQGNAWQHVAVTFDGSVANFYLNGNFVDTKSGNNFGANPNEVFALFGQPNQTEFFTGVIDEVRVYNTAMSQPEIVAAATATAGVPEPASVGAIGMGAVAMLARRRRVA